MSEIDEIVSDILNLDNQDDDKRNEATENLTNRFLVPQFLEILFQLIVDTNIQSDQNLFTLTLIVLKACLKYNYSKCEITDEVFLKDIPINLIQILNSIPPQFHSYIIDYFRHIIKIIFKRSTYDTNEEFLNSFQISILPFLIDQIKEQENFVSNLFIFKFFIKYYIKEDKENRNEELFSEILDEILPIFVAVFNSEEIDETTAEATLIVCQIMVKFIDEDIIEIKRYFNSQDVVEMITNYTNYFNAIFDVSKLLNRYLLELNKRYLIIYEDDSEFVSFMIPYLFNLSIKILSEMDSNTWDITIRNTSMKIINNMYYSGYFVEEINSEEFLTSILIPSAKLTEEELDDMLSIPALISSYFLSKNDIDRYTTSTNNSIGIGICNMPSLDQFTRHFNTNFLNYKDSYVLTVRPVCRSLASNLLKNPELRSFVAQQTDDPIEFESHIFLLSCLDSNSELVPSEEIQFILDSAISNFDSNPSFIQASFIYYLINHITLISDYSTLVELGVFCINNSDDPLVITASVDLLRLNRLHFKDFDNTEEKVLIIPKLLSFCDDFNYWEPIDVIVKLVKSEYYEMNEGYPEFLSEVLSALFENCLSIASRQNIELNEFDAFEDFEITNDNFELTRIFDNLIAIIKDLDITDELISFCLQNCSIIMKEIQSDSYYLALFCFVSFFNYQLRDPIDDQFDLIKFALSENSNVASYVLNAAYPLIINPQSNIESREEFVSIMADICQSLIDRSTNFSSIQDKKPDIDIHSLLRVCGALIEVFGEIFIGFVDFAFAMLNSDILSNYYFQDYFTHLVYVLYNAFVVDPETVVSNLNEKIINYMLNLSINVIACNLSPSGYGPYFLDEVKCHFCLLLGIARIAKESENELLVSYADKCFEKALIISKSFLYASDCKTQYEVGSFNSFLAMRSFPTSVEQVDVWNLFFEVADDAGFQLTDRELSIVNPIIHAMDNSQQNPEITEFNEQE